MKPQKKAEKIEKNTGYSLLIVGLILIIVPTLVAFAMFLIGSQIPQLVPVSSSETDAYVRATAIFSNVCLIIFIFIVIVWAGSIVTTRGVTMIKDVKLKLVRKSLREMAEIAEKSTEKED
jgi:uncharacterized membrane protein YdbT with pleckstrin-like domain